MHQASATACAAGWKSLPPPGKALGTAPPIRRAESCWRVSRKVSAPVVIGCAFTPRATNWYESSVYAWIEGLAPTATIGPVDKRRMCPNCRAFITTDDKVCPYCEVQVGPKAIDRRSPADLAGGLIPHAHFTTILILLLNTGLYIATLVRTASLTGGSLNTDPDG